MHSFESTTYSTDNIFVCVHCICVCVPASVGLSYVLNTECATRARCSCSHSTTPMCLCATRLFVCVCVSMCSVCHRTSSVKSMNEWNIPSSYRQRTFNSDPTSLISHLFVVNDKLISVFGFTRIQIRNKSSVIKKCCMSGDLKFVYYISWVMCLSYLNKNYKCSPECQSEVKRCWNERIYASNMKGHYGKTCVCMKIVSFSLSESQ